MRGPALLSGTARGGSFRVEELALQTRHTFRISRGGGDLWPNLLLRWEAEGGRTSYGEGAPRAYYEETVAQGADAIRSWFVQNPDLMERAPDMALQDLHGPASARAAVDMILHDLWAREAGVPLHAYLASHYGLVTCGIPHSSFTLGLAAPEEMAAKARDTKGFSSLKIKLGTHQDRQILQAVRSVTNAEFRVDANAAWSVDEALAMAPYLVEMGVTLLEQPLPSEDLAGYRALHEQLPAHLPPHAVLPVIADESCRRLADLERLVGAVDGVNLKLSKCGGLQEAAAMIRTARQAGLQVMVGCFIESSLAMTAAAALAPFADIVDLDGAALLAVDPFEGLRLPEGRVVLPKEPGLGARPRRQAS